MHYSESVPHCVMLLNGSLSCVVITPCTHQICWLKSHWYALWKSNDFFVLLRKRCPLEPRNIMNYDRG